MVTSFSGCLSKQRKTLNEPIFISAGKSNLVEVALNSNLNMSIWIRETKTDKEEIQTICILGKSICIITGYCWTENESGQDKQLGANDLIELYDFLGVDLFKSLQGSYAFILSHESKTFIVAGKVPGPIIYYSFNKNTKELFFSSEIKAFAFDAKLKQFDEEIERKQYCNPSLTIFRNIFRVYAGSYVFYNDIEFQFKIINFYSIHRQIEIFEEEEAKRLILDRLNRIIKRLPIKKKPSCLISGGLDSSIVAFLTNIYYQSPHTLSLGFQENNEFKESKFFANCYNLNYQESVMTESDLELSFLQVIGCVEHYHSTYIEYLTPVHFGNKILLYDYDYIVSGYGSDIIFGGFAKKDTSLSDVSYLIDYEYATSLWSGETSMALSNFHGKEIFYPYFQSDMIDLVFRIPTKLKYKNNTEKYILRAAFEPYLPKEIIYRAKLGIHHSSGTEEFFSEKIKNLTRKSSSQNLRTYKDLFAFICLRVLMEKKFSNDAFDFKYLENCFKNEIS